MDSANATARAKTIRIILIAAVAALLIAAAVYCIGPQCKYKISTYTMCSNRMGIQHLTYCPEHMYIKEIPQDLEKAFSTWNFELMKSALARAKEHDMNVKYKVEALIKEYGAARCQFTNCLLYTPSKAELYCQDHTYANEAMAEFCAAIMNYNAAEVDRIYNECKSDGLYLRKSDAPVQKAITHMVSQQTDLTMLLSNLQHLSSHFTGYLDVQPAAFSAIKDLFIAQAMDLTKMDPNQGYYADKQKSGNQYNDGLLATSSKRTYGYNYEVFSRTTRNAALGAYIEGSQSVEYKGITVADTLGAGIWAIETPDYDFVLVSNCLSVIDNKAHELINKIRPD